MVEFSEAGTARLQRDSTDNSLTGRDGACHQKIAHTLQGCGGIRDCPRSPIACLHSDCAMYLLCASTCTVLEAAGDKDTALDGQGW